MSVRALPCTLAALATLLVACGGERLPTVKVARPKIVRSSWDFLPEHWQEERLRKLFLRENFKEIRAEDEFALFLAGCDWAHHQWKSSYPKPYPLCNALDILDDIRSGKTGGFCGQYAYVLADVLKASGFFAVRYVELTRPDRETHFVVEAWSDEYAKWAVLDPSYNLWYRLKSGGAPASALDVRESLFGGPAVEPVAAGAVGLAAGAGDLAAYYANVAVSMRSELMRSTRPVTQQERYESYLFYRDGREVKPFVPTVPYRNVTSRRADVEFDCNVTRVDVERRPDRVLLSFHADGATPNFKEFVVRTDRVSDWKPAAATLEIPLTSGVRTVWVATSNQYNRRGVENRVDITW